MTRMDKGLVFEWTYYPVTLITFCMTMFLYRRIVPLISTKLSKFYKHLALYVQRSWDFRVVSCVHSLIVSATCFYTLLYDEVVYNDPVWSDRPLIRITCAIVVGFALADGVFMILDCQESTETVKYCIHHASTITAFYYVISYGILSYFANFRVMANFSTIFLNIRWMLEKENFNKSGTIYILNGCILCITFLSVRVFPMPKFWYTVYTYMGSEDLAPLGDLPSFLVVLCLLLDVLNVIWSVKILMGARKVLMANADSNGNEIKSLDKPQ